MKKQIVFSFLLMILLGACAKEKIVYKENPFVKTRKDLIVNTITTSNTVVNLHDSVVLYLVAQGDGLQYYWSASLGTLEANDSIAVFRSGFTGNAEISCRVVDQYQHEMIKSTQITVTTDLLFTGIAATDTLVPLNYPIALTAYATGDDIVFDWSANEDLVQTNGANAVFTATSPGQYTINCKVTDKLGNTESRQLMLTATELPIFKSLVANPEVVVKGLFSDLIATAFGDGLSYQWRCTPDANILGEGPQVKFSICHADRFKVTCTILDKSGNRSFKEVFIQVIEGDGN